MSQQRKHMNNCNKKHHFVEANVMNISAKFQLHPPYDFWGDDFWIFFREFILSDAMATNQIQWFGQNSCLVEDYSRNISVKLLSKYLQWDGNKSPFSLFPYKSMETLSCHSNQNAWATAIKNNNFVEAIVRNNSAKFQLYPPNSFWGVEFWIFFLKFYLLVAMVTNQSKKLQQKRYVL